MYYIYWTIHIVIVFKCCANLQLNFIYKGTFSWKLSLKGTNDEEKRHYTCYSIKTVVRDKTDYPGKAYVKV